MKALEEIAKDRLVGVEWREVTLEVADLRTILHELQSLKKEVAELKQNQRSGYSIEYQP